MQGSSGARAQCPRCQLVVEVDTAPIRKVSRCNRLDSSKRKCPEFKDDTLADLQPVQLPPQLSGTGTTWRLSDHTGEHDSF